MNKKEKATSKAPLAEYFNSESHGDSWHLFCKKCKKGWALKKDSDHPGNLLHLLNHAHGHKMSTCGSAALGR